MFLTTAILYIHRTCVSVLQQLAPHIDVSCSAATGGCLKSRPRLLVLKVLAHGPVTAASCKYVVYGISSVRCTNALFGLQDIEGLLSSPTAALPSTMVTVLSMITELVRVHSLQQAMELVCQPQMVAAVISPVLIQGVSKLKFIQFFLVHRNAVSLLF